MLPESNRKPYDMYEVIRRIVDDGEYFDMKPQWAKTIITCFARFGGRPVRDRRQPAQAARRHPRQRLGRQGGALRQPLQRVRDPARVHPGRARLHGRHARSRQGGIIRHGAKMLYAVANATVPKITVITAQGLRRRLLRDERPRVRARPDRRLAVGRDLVMGAEGAVEIVFRKQVEAGRGPGGEEGRADRRATARSSTSTSPRSNGMIDDVIDPRETREICRSLEMSRKKLERPGRAR